MSPYELRDKDSKFVTVDDITLHYKDTFPETRSSERETVARRQLTARSSRSVVATSNVVADEPPVVIMLHGIYAQKHIFDISPFREC